MLVVIIEKAGKHHAWTDVARCASKVKRESKNPIRQPAASLRVRAPGF